MPVNLKSLIGKLNNPCRHALEGAAGLCLSKSHFEVDIEHWLFKLIESPNTDFTYLLRYYAVNENQLAADLNRALEQFKTGNTRTPALSPRIPQWITSAWIFASIEYSTNMIRSGHLLCSLLASDDLSQLARQSSAELQKIDVEEIKTSLLDLTAGSEEEKIDRQTAQAKVTEDANASIKAKIFISYRRDDSHGWAGRLYDRLSQRFGRGSLFKDIEAIEPGLDFIKAIEDTVGSCDVLIAIIGRHWLMITDDKGQRRLYNPEDLVRLEIATALDRNIRVIPALVEGASMPRFTDLPDNLKPLTRRNSLRFSETHFDHDVNQLAEVLERELDRHRNHSLKDS